jgi:hypothetical protein
VRWPWNRLRVVESPDPNHESRRPRGCFYGGDGTIHGTTHLDVETRNGVVVAVWYRCQMLAFEQHEREESIVGTGQGAKITGVEVLDDGD